QAASGAKPLRGVGKNSGAALPANSDYPKHCRSLPRTLPWYSVKFSHTLRLDHGNEMAQLIFDVAGRRHGVGDLLSQYRLIALPESVKRLSDCILGHPQARCDLRL